MLTRFARHHLPATAGVVVASATAVVIVLTGSFGQQSAVRADFVPQLPGSQVLKADLGIVITPASTSSLPTGSISQAAAEKIAVSHGVVGSRVLGSMLAEVSDSASHHGLCWVVSVNPSQPLLGSGEDPRPANFDLEIIDAPTGFALERLSGIDPSLPPFPPLR